MPRWMTSSRRWSGSLPIYETVRRVKAALEPQTTFLGFAGSPWTVATYMIAGQGSREQAEARQLAYDDPGKMDAILDAIASVTVDYLSGQVEAGVEAVQLFDSWSGSLAPAQFERFVIARNAWIVAELKQRHPDTPIIGFPKGAGGKLGAYARETGVDAIGLDETVDPVWADRELPARHAGAGQSRPAGVDRRRRAAARCDAPHP